MVALTLPLQTICCVDVIQVSELDATVTTSLENYAYILK